MKYALIGCGRISPNHLEAAINNNLEIVGLCDIIPENIDKLLNKLNIDVNKYKKYTNYKEMLEKVVSIPIYLQDERLTTKSATDMLIMGNVSRKDRKKVVDSVAATIILQSFLDKKGKEDERK